MSSVDKRVVQMEFDNQQFQNGVRTSVNSLNELKRGLDLSGATRGLNELDKAGRSFSLAGIANGVDAIANKFTTLGIVGVTAIANLTNSAMNAGKNMVSALTVDPIKSGLDEYETKMGAIQTILTNTASKGTTLDDVNTSLAELNTYADQTIYNFAEMTKNIGTFTAAGVDLKTATTSIKGIANLAAGSGSTSLQASTAMYQLSQALAAGSVKLQDWNSVVNAGMGGELFQKALEKTATELGKGRDMSVSFRESLQDGWITSEVLTKTLQKFASDESLLKAATQVKTFTQLFDTMKESVQSGWAVSWENIIGDKEQSSKMLTGISDAFNSLIGPSTDARNAMLSFWNANGGRDAIIESFSNAFNGLGSVLKPIGEAFRNIFPPMTGERLVEISKYIRDLSANFKISDSTAAKLKGTFTGLFSALNILAQVVITIAKGFGVLLGILKPTGSGFLDMTNAIGNFLTNLNDTVKTTGVLNDILEKFKATIKPLPNLFDWLAKIPPLFFKFAESIKQAFGVAGKYMTEGLDKINFERLFVIINGTLTASLLLGLKKIVGAFTDTVKSGGGFLSGIKNIIGGITDVLSSAKDSLKSFQDSLKAGTLLKIAAAIGILAASLTVLSMIDPGKLAQALGAITSLFVELLGAMAIFDKLSNAKGFSGVGKLTVVMLGLSTALLILSFAMKNLSELDWNGVMIGMTSLAGLTGILIVAAKILSANSGTMIKGALGFIFFSTALLILSKAMEKIGSLKPEVIGNGLLGLGAVLLELVVFMKTVDLGSIGIKGAASLILLAMSLNIIADAISKFGNMQPETLLKGLYTLTYVLSAISMFMLLTGSNGMSMGSATGLLILSVALTVLSGVIGSMGNLPIDVIAKGLGTLAASLIIMGVAMKYMQGSIGGATAMLIMAAALAVMTPVIKILGKMPVKEIAKALITIAGVFVILGVAAAVLAPLIPAMLGLGVAILIIGGGAALAGAGILIISAGLTALAASLTLVASSIVFVVTTLIGLIPVVIKGLGDAIVAFSNMIIQTTPVVIQAIMTMLTAILDAIVAFVPQLVIGGMKMILGVLQGIADNIPLIVTAATDIVVNFLDAIATNLPRIVEAGMNLAVSFINGLADALRNNTDTLVSAIQNLIGAVVDAGAKVLTGSIETFTGIGKNAVAGFINGIKSGVGALATAAANAAHSAYTAAKEALDVNSPSKVFESLGMFSVRGLANGLINYAGIAANAAKELGNNAISALSGAIANISDIVSSDVDINPTIRPVLDLTDINSGLNSAFSNTQGISVIGTQNKISTIATMDQNRRKSLQNGYDSLNSSDNSINYNVTVNNPEPAAATEDVRKTLLKCSYAM